MRVEKMSDFRPYLPKVDEKALRPSKRRLFLNLSDLDGLPLSKFAHWAKELQKEFPNGRFFCRDEGEYGGILFGVEDK